MSDIVNAYYKKLKWGSGLLYMDQLTMDDLHYTNHPIDPQSLGSYCQALNLPCPCKKRDWFNRTDSNFHRKLTSI